MLCLLWSVLTSCPCSLQIEKVVCNTFHFKTRDYFPINESITSSPLRVLKIMLDLNWNVELTSWEKYLIVIV